MASDTCRRLRVRVEATLDMGMRFLGADSMGDGDGWEEGS